MARVSMPTIGSRGQDARPLAASASDPPPAPRTVLGALLSRASSKVADWLERGGRLSLYIGLLLVTFQAVRAPGNLGSIADPFLLVSLLCAFLVAARGRAFNIAIFKLHAVGLLLVCAGVLASTVANATDDWQSIKNLTKFVFTTTGTFFACVVLLKRSKQLKLALGFWVGSAALTSLAALLQLSLGGTGLDYEGQHWGRLSGLTGNPNGLGAVAAIALAPALSLAALSKGGARVLWLVAVVLCVCGVVVSASRSGAIVAIATLIPWLVLHYRSNKEFVIFVAGCCLMGAAIATYVYADLGGRPNVSDRLADAATAPYDEAPVVARLEQYSAVLRDASFLGTGLAKEESAVHGFEIHNMFLMLLHAGGLLSFLGILVIVADLARQGIFFYWSIQESERKILGISLTLGVFGLVLSSMAGPVLYQRKEWVPAALLFALMALGRRRRSSADSHGSSKAGRRARRHALEYRSRARSSP